VWRTAPTLRYPRARTERDGHLRSLADSNGKKNVVFKIGLLSRWAGQDHDGKNCPDPPGGQEVPGSNPGSPTTKVQARRRGASLRPTCGRRDVPTGGRPGPAPIETVPTPAAIVGARDAQSFPSRSIDTTDRTVRPPHRQQLRLMSSRWSVVGWRACRGPLPGAQSH
jgi:hypothetical protein